MTNLTFFCLVAGSRSLSGVRNWGTKTDAGVTAPPEMSTAGQVSLPFLDTVGYSSTTDTIGLYLNWTRIHSFYIRPALSTVPLYKFGLHINSSNTHYFSHPSSDTHNTYTRWATVSPPTTPLPFVVRPGGPPEKPMTAEIIQQGLNSIAATLNSKRVNIVIVAVGGAVNTLLLRTCESTTDVDFFYWTKTKHEDITRVIVAADVATTKLKLGDQWLNNHTAVFIEVHF